MCVDSVCCRDLLVLWRSGCCRPSQVLVRAASCRERVVLRAGGGLRTWAGHPGVAAALGADVVRASGTVAMIATGWRSRRAASATPTTAPWGVASQREEPAGPVPRRRPTLVNFFHFVAEEVCATRPAGPGPCSCTVRQMPGVLVGALGKCQEGSPE